MTCNGCKTIVENSLNLLDQVISCNADIRLGELTLRLNKDVSLKSLQNVIPKKYIINEQISLAEIPGEILDDVTNVDSKLKQLKPLFLILFYITSSSILINYQNWNSNKFMLDFMGIFFISFSFFKILYLKGFSDSFKIYDLLPKEYPFTECYILLLKRRLV